MLVWFRYCSLVFFEFYLSGKWRKMDMFVVFWFCDVLDLEEKDFNIFIWRCNNGLRFL